MIINISDLMKRSNIDAINVDFEEKIDVIEIYGKIIKILEPIKVTGIITTDGEIANFIGQANLKFQTECDRCMNDYKRDFTMEIEEKFTNDSYSEDETEYYQMNDNKIDFTPVINHNLHMNMPIKFLCSEDCKGIIDRGEINKNEFSPFADLNKMFKNQGGR
ncbi:MAG TPA: hypothetical protein DEP72_00425 [Clostridiales bacterium]|nr:MAG: hypothetical protein A2Y18_01010 [Clostridiales bacterium GWD2_32_19]HCC06616.1 hypothetical protein [Clostridiales bacterium]